MARATLAERVEAEQGRPFEEVLDGYGSAPPEEIALGFGCSLGALMREASKKGFKIVNVRRFQRQRSNAA